MNYFDYQDAIRQNPNFDEEHTFMVELSNVDYTENQEGNEARTTVASSNPQLREELKQYGGNHTPITVSSKGGGIFILDDGFTRYRELSGLGYKFAKAIRSNWTNPSDRLWGNLNANIPPVTFTEATYPDIVSALVRDIKQNFALGSNIDAIKAEQVETLLRSRLRKSLHGNAIRSIVKKTMDELPNTIKFYLNYASKDDAAKKFSDINPWGIKVERSGTTVRDKDGQLWAVYFAGTKTYFFQNGIHSAFWKKNVDPESEEQSNLPTMGKEAPKVLLVCYDEKVFNNGGSLNDYRKSCLEFARNVNEHPMVKGSGVKLYDRFCVLPQIRKVVGTDKPENFNELVNQFTVEL